MKKPFEVGDRVRVCVCLQGSPLETCGEVHTVEPKRLRVLLDHVKTSAGQLIWAHPGQCVRLKPKPKAKVKGKGLERMWFRSGNGGATHEWQYTRPNEYEAFMWEEFVRIAPTDIVTSENGLRKLWANGLRHEVINAPPKSEIEILIKALKAQGAT